MADPEILNGNSLRSRLIAELGHHAKAENNVENVLEILSRRKNGEFQDVKIVLAKHPFEEIHAFSQTPFFINFPKSDRATEPARTTSSLRMLRKKDISQNSQEALSLISPYEELPSESVNNKDFYSRTLDEIEAISRAYDGLEKGKDAEKRKELRQLRDRLIIDRIISPYAHKNLPENIKVSVKLNNQIVTVFLLIGDGEDELINEQPIIIEAPIEGRYSIERNHKLSECLALLGEI